MTGLDVVAVVSMRFVVIIVIPKNRMDSSGVSVKFYSSSSIDVVLVDSVELESFVSNSFVGLRISVYLSFCILVTIV